MSVDHSAQSGRAPLADRGNDLYETPECAVRALLDVERLPDTIWEPACGRSAIVRVLASAGHRVYATDLVNYAAPEQDAAGIDFLFERQLPSVAAIGAIVTNPPYKLAGQFVLHALTFGVPVYMLLRLAFLESERRRTILENGWLRRVYVFRNRLPMMYRHGYSRTLKQGSSAIPFAWFCWDPMHSGPTELRRISWSAA